MRRGEERKKEKRKRGSGSHSIRKGCSHMKDALLCTNDGSTTLLRTRLMVVPLTEALGKHRCGTHLRPLNRPGATPMH